MIPPRLRDVAWLVWSAVGGWSLHTPDQVMSFYRKDGADFKVYVCFSERGLDRQL
jgi:hypothetical protein